MSDHSIAPDRRLAYRRERRRRRLVIMLARYALVTAVVLVVAWLTGGYWLRGLALIATAFLVLRLAVFFYNGRHLEERIADGTQHRRRRFLRR